MNGFIQSASYFNASGVGIVLLVSLLILSRYSATFFRPWVCAYASAFAFLTTEAIAAATGRSFWLSMVDAAFMTSTAWFVAQTVLHFRHQMLPRVLYPIVLAANVALTGFLMSRGIEYQLAAIVPALSIASGFCWLGITILRGKALKTQAGLSWLGLPLLLTGLLPFTFPVMVGTPFAWVGYWLGGMLNVLMGVSMVVYLLENTAWQLRERNEALTQLDQMKSNLLATVSHELRTPLAAIKGSASVLAMPFEMPVAERTRLIDLIGRNSDRLEGLIKDLLDLSQLEAGRMRYHLIDADVRSLIRDASHAIGPVMASKKLHFTLEVPDEAVWVRFDPDRLAQVVTNLLSNASKFTPEGGRVTLRLKRHQECARIEVEDSGIGIAPHNQDKIFSRFYQVDNSTTRKVGGTGLGLAICRNIVEEGHHGTITVHSRLGEGSLFRVELPLHQPASLARNPLV